MIARVSVTAVAAHFLNPFGIMFLLLAVLIWLGWEPIREDWPFTPRQDHMTQQGGMTWPR